MIYWSEYSTKTWNKGLQQDDSSSSSSSAAISKASKTAAIIAAAKANQQKSVEGEQQPKSPGEQPSSSGAASSSTAASSSSSLISEDEVRRYLKRTPMTTKELLHKFKNKTQNTMTKEQLLECLMTILNKLQAKMTDQNGVKYLYLW